MPSISVSHKPVLRDAISLTGYAHEVSGGDWVCYPHIRVICDALMELMYGNEYDNLLIMCPPRHGKSYCCSYYFPPFYLGTNPNHRVILTAYDTEFAEEWGGMSKRLFKETGPRFFGRTTDPDREAVGNWKIKDTVNGGMISTGINSGITGKGANLLIIDDPIKNPDEAFSEAYRRRTWNNFVSVCMYRRQKGAKAAMLYTPWHDDDIGQTVMRLSAEGAIKPWKIIRMPAIAETQESRDEWAEEFGLPLGMPDPIGRLPGEALCPDLIPIEQLRETQAYDEDHFESLYQGRPHRHGGSFFKVEWFVSEKEKRDQFVDSVPTHLGHVEWCRYWDRAASSKRGDYTAGVLMAKIGPRYYIADIKFGQWEPGERDQIILQTAHEDRDNYGRVKIVGEQEPGSAGVDVTKAFVTMLDGFDAEGRTNTGDKETRAYNLASQAKVGNVYIVRNQTWNKRFMQEVASFGPKAKHDDLIDAASGAHNTLRSSVATVLKLKSPTSGWYGRRVPKVG